MQQLLRVCAHCGQPIPKTKRSVAKYCSDACRKAASDRKCAARINAYQRAYRKATYVPRPRKHENDADMRLKKNYGISLQEWRELREQQGGKCPICGTELCSDPSHKTHVDHCHETGAVRGILCASCNTGLGKFNDSIGTLEAAVKYLYEARLASTAQAA